MVNKMDNIREKSFSLLLVELEKAEKKHPFFPGGTFGVSTIAEELGELAQAVNDAAMTDYEIDEGQHIIEEAAHVAVCAMRFIENALRMKQWVNETKGESK